MNNIIAPAGLHSVAKRKDTFPRQRRYGGKVRYHKITAVAQILAAKIEGPPLSNARPDLKPIVEEKVLVQRARSNHSSSTLGSSWPASKIAGMIKLHRAVKPPAD